MCAFLPVPWAPGRRGFPSVAGSVCSGTRDGKCSRQQSLETLRSVSWNNVYTGHTADRDSKMLLREEKAVTVHQAI